MKRLVCTNRCISNSLKRSSNSTFIQKKTIEIWQDLVVWCYPTTLWGMGAWGNFTETQQLATLQGLGQKSKMEVEPKTPRRRGCQVTYSFWRAIEDFLYLVSSLSLFSWVTSFQRFLTPFIYIVEWNTPKPYSRVPTKRGLSIGSAIADVRRWQM